LKDLADIHFAHAKTSRLAIHLQKCSHPSQLNLRLCSIPLLPYYFRQPLVASASDTQPRPATT
jgi:hypothetical protein